MHSCSYLVFYLTSQNKLLLEVTKVGFAGKRAPFERGASQGVDSKNIKSLFYYSGINALLHLYLGPFPHFLYVNTSMEFTVSVNAVLLFLKLQS